MSLQFDLAEFHRRKREASMKKQQQQRFKKEDAKSTASRTAAVAITKNFSTPGATVKNIGPQFWEKDGIRIPLYKGGKKRSCASASATLRNKKMEELLHIVEEYAGIDKRREMEREEQTKGYIADWIELKETLALGRNQHSKLPLNVQTTQPKGGNDTVRAPKPGLAPSTSTTKKMTVSVVSKVESRRIHARQETLGLPKTQTLKGQRPAVTLTAKTESLHTNEAQPKKQEHNSQRSTSSIGSAALNKSLTNAERSDKRKHDNAHDSTLPQQTVKKQRTHNLTGAASAAPLAILNPSDMQHQPQQHTVHFQDSITQRHEQGEAGSTTNVVNTITEEAPAQLERSSVIDLGQNRDKTLPVTTDAKHSHTFIRDTPISHNRNKLSVQKVQPSVSVEIYEPPFLKPGIHGRHGDFDNDDDRLTGRGHQMTLEDERKHHNYLQFCGEFYAMYPTYPALAEGTDIHPDLLKTWIDNEIWYRRFKEKYSGLAPIHLWDCGCEKISDESESEAE